MAMQMGQVKRRWPRIWLWLSPTQREWNQSPQPSQAIIAARQDPGRCHVGLGWEQRGRQGVGPVAAAVASKHGCGREKKRGYAFTSGAAEGQRTALAMRLPAYQHSQWTAP